MRHMLGARKGFLREAGSRDWSHDYIAYREMGFFPLPGFLDLSYESTLCLTISFSSSLCSLDLSQELSLFLANSMLTPVSDLAGAGQQNVSNGVFEEVTLTG